MGQSAVGQSATLETALKRIEGLAAYDADGARAIITEALTGGLPSLGLEALFKPLAKALGVKEASARKLCQQAEAQAAEHATRRTPEQLASQAKQTRREKDAERSRLWATCKELAERPTLLTDMVNAVHTLGVVGEAASIKGAYLAAMSRLNRSRAICLLRRGAAAGGKNFLISKALALFPSDSVIHMTSGSPLSLVYYGGGDENALQHKVLYIPEAAILAEKNKVENLMTIMLRVLISEGRLDHNVVIPQNDGPPLTKHIKRNGPVAVIVTSARDNIEDRAVDSPLNFRRR